MTFMIQDFRYALRALMRRPMYAAVTMLVLAIGSVAALALGSALASQIYAVNAVEPGIFGIALSGLTAAGLLAAWLPARRAARIDPARVLREE